jgi:hypothetical protein
MSRTLSIMLCALAVACVRGPEGTEPNDCGNRQDEDSDGLMDCEDQGCATTPLCVQKIEEARRAAEAAEKAEKAAAKKAAEEAALAELQSHFEAAGLWVQKHHNGKDVNLAEAKAYCEQLELGGQRDWRLPTEEEAVEIFKSGGLNPEPYAMWTSTTHGTDRGVIVGITSGAPNELGVRFNGDCRARCVRGK